MLYIYNILYINMYRYILYNKNFESILIYMFHKNDLFYLKNVKNC